LACAAAALAGSAVHSEEASAQYSNESLRKRCGEWPPTDSRHDQYSVECLGEREITILVR
jgi:heme A synthase